MIDCTKLETKIKSYGGANGNKKSVIYNGELYMLKLPSNPRINKDLSYSNSTISEYISSFVFHMANIPCQETVLGEYVHNDIKRICVLCKDFETNGFRFADFASLRNQVVDSNTNGHSTELDDILSIFASQDIVKENDLKKFFWSAFVVDALLGNWDRHNGNWGYLYNIDTGESKIAPVFDNGSSLYPQADEKIMSIILSNANEMNKRIYEVPLSAITINNIKINYYDYLTSNPCEDCKEALLSIVPLINVDKINNFIDEIDILSSVQKTFYKTMIKNRKEKILDVAYNKIKK
mgnify:CR=1 FL=1